MRLFFVIIFYKLHAFAKFCSKDNLYQYTAMFLLSLLVFLNCVTVLAYYRCLFEHSPEIYPSKQIILIVAFLLAGVNYFVFVNNRKYESFFEELLKNGNLKGRSGTLITIVYIVVTFAFLSSTIWLKCH